MCDNIDIFLYYSKYWEYILKMVDTGTFSSNLALDVRQFDRFLFWTQNSKCNAETCWKTFYMPLIRPYAQKGLFM